MNSTLRKLTRGRWLALLIGAALGVFGASLVDDSIEPESESSVALLPTTQGLATLQVFEAKLEGDVLSSRLVSSAQTVASGATVLIEIDNPTILITARSPSNQDVRRAADSAGVAAIESLETEVRTALETNVGRLQARIREIDIEIEGHRQRIDELLQARVAADSEAAANPTVGSTANALQLADEVDQSKRERNIAVSNRGVMSLDLERLRRQLAEVEPPFAIVTSASAASRVGYSSRALYYMGIVLGLVLAGTLVYLEDAFRGKFHSDEQIQRTFGLSVIARETCGTGRVFVADGVIPDDELTYALIAPTDASVDVVGVVARLQEHALACGSNAVFRGMRAAGADRVSGEVDRLILTVRTTTTRRRAASRAAAYAKGTGIPIVGLIIQHE